MRLDTRLRSTMMRVMASAGFAAMRRRRARLARKLRGQPSMVHYFHQVDDPYSHLVVQKLDELRATYPSVPFKAHLVSAPDAAFQGSEQHFAQWARRDAMSIAGDYGTTFEGTVQPGAAMVAKANDTLAAELDHSRFAKVAFEVGEKLWSDCQADDSADVGPGEQALVEGNRLRTRLGHYQGGMFYFEGDWYWVVDRIRVLEQRLVDEGFSRNGSELCVPQPALDSIAALHAPHVHLEYFPSLRSPYTAVGHQRVLDLVERTGVTVVVRPVMPMMMRGVPAPRAKQMYIITDAAREARAFDVPFGRIVDPFGEPVKQAFALFPGATMLGQEMAFVTAYLSAAWAEGIDVTTEKGLRQVAWNARINWAELTKAADMADWEKVLGLNLDEMLAAGLWGVPSFRVSGGDEPPFACWGQDRIWRVEKEIARRASQGGPGVRQVPGEKVV